MVLTILAYVVALMTSQIVQLLGTITLPLIEYLRYTPMLVRCTFLFLLNGTLGVLTVWWSVIVFGWFDVEPTILYIMILGLYVINNDRKRLLRAYRWIEHESDIAKITATEFNPSKNLKFEYSNTFGDISGLVLGGVIFLQGATFI